MLNNKINMEQHQVLLGDLKKQRRKEYREAWYETKGRDYYAANKEKTREYYKRYREEHKEEKKAYMKEYMRQYYHNNKEKWIKKKQT